MGLWCFKTPLEVHICGSRFKKTERKSICIYTKAPRREEEEDATPCKNVRQKLRGPYGINTYTTAVLGEKRTGEGRE